MALREIDLETMDAGQADWLAAGAGPAAVRPAMDLAGLGPGPDVDCGPLHRRSHSAGREGEVAAARGGPGAIARDHRGRAISPSTRAMTLDSAGHADLRLGEAAGLRPTLDVAHHLIACSAITSDLLAGPSVRPEADASALRPRRMDHKVCRRLPFVQLRCDHVRLRGVFVLWSMGGQLERVPILPQQKTRCWQASCSHRRPIMLVHEVSIAEGP